MAEDLIKDRGDGGRTMMKEITEAQITELMAAIPRAEEVDRLRAEVERLRETNERLREAAEDALWFIGTEYDRVGLHKAGKSWRSTKDGAAYKLRAALKEDGR
jgi:DNA repair ATPase RecN